MQWIILCLAAAFLFSISVFIDNYLADVIFKGKQPQAIKAIDGFLYLLLLILMAIVFDLKPLATPTIIIAVIAGIVTALASLPYYLGLRDEESTTAAIFFQAIPILCIIGDFFVLGQKISLQQINGFVLVLTAPLVVALARRRKSARKTELRAAGFFLLYVLLRSAGYIIYAKAEQDKPDATTLFFWFIAGRAIFDLSCTIIMKSFRTRIKQILKVNPAKFIIAAIATLGLAAIGDFLVRYSYLFTATSLATALSNASELIFTFVLGIILTLIWPKFGREKLSRHIVISHLIAVILIVIGIILAN